MLWRRFSLDSRLIFLHLFVLLLRRALNWVGLTIPVRHRRGRVVLLLIPSNTYIRFLFSMDRWVVLLDKLYMVRQMFSVDNSLI